MGTHDSTQERVTLKSLLQRFKKIKRDLPENSAAIQQFEDKLKELLENIPKQHFEWVKGVVIGSGLASAAFVPAAMLSAAGFTTAGIAAGSMAAGIQSSIGSVSAGSAFATFQSMGATAALTPPGLVVAGIGAVASGGYFGCRKLKQKVQHA
eukprot:TRINITY_DN704_c0_g1_i1.p2 TRINITY_DN704_c0_g1~~TRINITY_DN704_c0_g1_i1.p2  ORF type:complete len:152 (+),score=14.82 TRINITY_DN704_c0_g1_i1:164-619(+)